MKKVLIAAVFAAAVFVPCVRSGQITAGAVPGSINYQGRLERDNAPVSGPLFLTFKIFNAATGGTQRWPESGAGQEVAVEAVQGIFSANLTPPLEVFSRNEQLYLEVQVQSEVLSPREPLSSVAYALVAKRIEDGSDLSISTLTVEGNITLSGAGHGITFPNGSFMIAANVGSAAGGIASDDFVTIRAANVSAGDVIFNTPAKELARITSAGNMGIATASPGGTLDVNGSIMVGSAGIHGRTPPGDVNIMANVYVSSGRVTGGYSEYLSLGENDDVIALVSGGGERLRVHSNGNVGIGLSAPEASLQAAGVIYSTTALRGAAVTVGSYDNSSYLNEVRTQGDVPLLLQQNSLYNVGIGTDSPKEKLHVRGNVRADYGIIAATASFSDAVVVRGDFTANSGLGSRVFLSSTTIYGTLEVTGGIGSAEGPSAYLGSDNAFTGLNTFQKQIVVSSDIVTPSRIGAGVTDFDFSGSKYLQVGDSNALFSNDDALAYLVGGGNADAKVGFYRGAAQIAGLETQRLVNSKGLALTVGGQTKMLVDDVYWRMYNNAVWISTAYGTTPAIFVSSAQGNVGIGTAVTDPNWKLTVNGSIRISGPASNGIVFADGSSMVSAGSIGAATQLSNNGDALVQADLDNNGVGSVVLRSGSVDGLVINSGGKVGIGTLTPTGKLNIQGGALVLGSPQSIASYLAGTNLLVGGDLVVDGALTQRSLNKPVAFASLTVSDNVYLSTSAASRTGIGNTAPAYKLDVTGDINASGSIRTGNTQRISAAGVLTGATWNGNLIGLGYGGTNRDLAAVEGGVVYSDADSMEITPAGAAYAVLIAGGPGVPPAFGSVSLDQAAAITGVLPVGNGGTGAGAFTSGGILYGNGASDIGATPVLGSGELLIGNGSGVPTISTITGTANRVSVTNAPGVITLSAPQDIHAGASPAFSGLTISSLSGVLKGNGGSAVSAMTGAPNAVARWSDGNTISSGALTDDGADAAVGTVPTTGIKLDVNGKLRATSFQMPNPPAGNYVLTGDSAGNARWALTVSTNSAYTWAQAQTFTNGITCTACITLTEGAGSEVTGTLALGNGGTGQVTKTAAFDALSPMTAAGDIIYGGASGTGTRLAAADGFLKSVGGVPAWSSISKSDVGLGNADNTADADKPVSTAQQTELDKKAELGTAATGFVVCLKADGISLGQCASGTINTTSGACTCN